MSAHEAVLLFSPVLAHHCAWAFKKEIRLEEDPTIFSRLLKFLYTNDFEPHWPTIPDRLIAVMSQDALISYAGIFAQLFVMADKYKLQKLKIAVMRKYDNIHTYLPVLKMWGVAEEICSRISEDDITFFDWFKNNPRRTYGPMMDIEVLDKVNFGRQLGMNILKAVCFQMNGHGENKQRNQRPDRERSNNTAEYGHHRKIDLNVAVVTLRTLVRELEGTGFNSNRRVRCLCGQRGCRECPENICFLWVGLRATDHNSSHPLTLLARLQQCERAFAQPSLD